MTLVQRKNQELKLKKCIQSYLELILILLKLNYKIKYMLPTEDINDPFERRDKILENFKHFPFLTENYEIVILDLKKDRITEKYLEEMYEYYRKISFKYDRPVHVIIIGLSDDKETCLEFKDGSVIFTPLIIHTKQISKQQELDIITDKTNEAVKLTRTEAALLATLPIFKTDLSEADVTQKASLYLRHDKELMPEDMLNTMREAMYLNVHTYINDKNEQEYLNNHMGIGEPLEGTFAKIKKEPENEGMYEGQKEGKKQAYEELLEKFTLSELSERINMKPKEILDILNSS